MGVLAGLHDSGKLKNVDVISSVSGGGYAAYFYFSRLLAVADGDRFGAAGATPPGESADWFRHCLTFLASQYFKGGTEDGGHVQIELADRWRVIRHLPEQPNLFSPDYCAANAIDRTSATAAIDPYRFQNHVSGFQDFLSPGFDYSRVGNLGRDTGNNRIAAALGVATLGSLPGHWLSNVAFDFGLRISPLQHRYQAGFVRAYGYLPSIHGQGSDEEGYDTNVRGVSAARLEALNRRQAHFGALRDIYAPRAVAVAGVERPPLWIVNVTATDRAALDVRLNDPLRHSFELTPFGFGSPCYGLFTGAPDAIGMGDAMAASAAFLDWQQRSTGASAPPINGALHLFNVSMGFDYPNPARSEIARTMAKLTPLPLVWASMGLFPGCTGGEAAGPTQFHFSDGGQSENLGLLPLIRRRVPNIYVSDASQDEYGRMEDLCVLVRAGKKGDPALSTKDRRIGWRIEIDGLKDIDEHCTLSDGSRGYDVLDWRNPAMSGRVRIAEIDASGNFTAELPKRGDRCPVRDGVMPDCLELIWLKPAIDLRSLDAMRRLYFNGGCACNEIKRSKGGGGNAAQCVDALEASLTKIDRPVRYPPSVVRFVFDNWEYILKDNRVSQTERSGNLCEPIGHRTARRRPPGQFPQNSTLTLTLNSSPTLYEGYRDLARFATIWATQRQGTIPTVPLNPCVKDTDGSFDCSVHPAKQ